ncbi:hypothetical protein SAMN02910291_00299 [Desulfovibrio desulfuricans]|uniref:Uncharacterized protein n=1 Tax=Desulfovibrio desulfuricans TaxID=876 RepID=A0AA94HQH3_DESDE|nr:hypothetical protein SAMN02910291_00299 [Desulfovibrio desulfuricans]
MANALLGKRAAVNA